MVGLYVFPEQVSSLNASLFWPCSAVPFPSSRPAASSPGVFRTKIYTFPSPSPLHHVFSLWFPCRPKLPPGDARCSCGASLPVRAAPASQSLSLWAWGTPNGEARTSPHALHCLGWGKCRVSVSPIIGRWCQQHLFRPTVTSPPHLAPRASLIRSRPDLAASFLPPQQSVPAPSHKIPADFRSFIFFACTSL